MKQRLFLLSTVFIVALVWFITVPVAFAAEPIVIGVPTSLGFLEGKESHKVVQMAVSEINAKGGVNVAGTRRMQPPAFRFPKHCWDWKRSFSRKSRPPSWWGRFVPKP